MNFLLLLRKITPSVFLMLVLLMSTAAGQSYFNGLGLFSQSVFDARSGGMGLSRTALSQGVWSIGGNPSHLSKMTGFQISASLIIDQVKEERSIEAIDQFNDVVAKNIYAANTNSFRKYAFAAGYGFGNYALAYSQTPIKDFSYKYSEEVRNSLSSSYYNRDPLAGYHGFEMSGQIMAHAFGVSAGQGNATAGLSLVTYTDTDLIIEKSVSVLQPDDALASDTSFSSRSLQSLDQYELGYLFGLSYTMNSGFSIHYALEKIGDLSLISNGVIPFADSTKRYPEYFLPDSSLLYKVETPAVHRIGIAFSPGQKNKTIAVFELELHQGQSITYSRSIHGSESFNYELMATRIVHVGIEHWASSTLPLRMGYSYEESPLENSLAKTRFTAGGSLIYGPFRLDLSGQMTSLGYVYPDLFPAEGTSALSESVNETLLGLFATATYQMP